ncbi:GIY-YIG nuclease family protein [Patescibacteria group bacterium]
MYYCYVLESKIDKNFYIGFTENLKQRLRDHNSGKNLSTQIRKPFNLIYYEAFLNKFDALRRERYFKTTKGKTSLKQILREYLTNK